MTSHSTQNSALSQSGAATDPAASARRALSGNAADCLKQIIVNADDWGRDRPNTDRALECFRAGGVSAVSEMVFMEDSERAAAIAREHAIDTGLHLNLTTPFSAHAVPVRLIEHQDRLARYLLRHRFSSAIFHPGLMSSFEYVVRAQLEEFARLHDALPARLDGHQHMHLSANVLLQKLMPKGIRVRRNFSFRRGEKNLLNRQYRRAIDSHLRKHYCLTDAFVSLAPMTTARLDSIFSLARECAVEMETHPVKPEEYEFLSGGGLFRWAKGEFAIACGFPNVNAAGAAA